MSKIDIEHFSQINPLITNFDALSENEKMLLYRRINQFFVGIYCSTKNEQAYIASIEGVVDRLLGRGSEVKIANSCFSFSVEKSSSIVFDDIKLNNLKKLREFSCLAKKYNIKLNVEKIDVLIHAVEEVVKLQRMQSAIIQSISQAVQLLEAQISSRFCSSISAARYRTLLENDAFDSSRPGFKNLLLDIRTTNLNIGREKYLQKMNNWGESLKFLEKKCTRVLKRDRSVGDLILDLIKSSLFYLNFAKSEGAVTKKITKATSRACILRKSTSSPKE